MDGRRASRKTLRNSSVCRRTRRNWNAFSTMSAQLTMEKTIRMKRTTLAIGPEFQTRARIPVLSVSLGTGAPLVCVQHIYGIITTSVGRAVVLPLLLASISMGVPVAAGQDARAAVEAFVARLPDVRISDLVIDQNLTLYHPGGRGPSSVGEQRMFFKLPQRQRLEQTVEGQREIQITDRKSTRLNSSHSQISYAVFCLKKKKKIKKKKYRTFCPPTLSSYQHCAVTTTMH